MARHAAMLIVRLGDIRFLRYLLASVGALAADVSTFLGALALGAAAGPASALGYMLGILTHWLLSSRTVFQGSVAASGRERSLQKALFVIAALVGLALTTLIVGLADSAGFDPRLAKGAAIIVNFLVNWLILSRVVFATPERG